MRTIVIATLIAVLGTAPLAAQNLAPLRGEIGGLADATAADLETTLVNLRDNLSKALLLQGAPLEAVQEILAFRRADVQLGAGSGASGSTSVVASPLLPAIFGVALENGAITRTVSGTTITIKANPAGLFCASAPGGAAAVARRDEEACRTFWNRVGVSASFDTSRGEDSASLDSLKALNNEFSDLTVRVVLIDHRQATGERYQKLFSRPSAAWQAKAQRFANASGSIDAQLATSGVLEELDKELRSVVSAAAFTTLPRDQRIARIEAAIKKVLAGATLNQAELDSTREAWAEALRADRALQNAIANAAVLTSEYAYRQADVATAAIGTVVPEGVRPPSLHAFTLIYAQGWADHQLDVTLNGGVTLFDETRPGMSGSFRDARVGGEAKFKLRDIGGWGAPTLSFAGLYQYLHQEPLGLGITFNEAAINKPGHIGVFQTKVEFPTANNAIRIPLSFTYANRTELIKEADVRGQFGLSFNLDALFAEKEP